MTVTTIPHQGTQEMDVTSLDPRMEVENETITRIEDLKI